MISMPKNMIKQQGNVFIMILAAIFLFGALAFTFSQGASKGEGNLSKHQARLAAQEILNYGRSIEQAVDRVRRNGCSENEISFDNDVQAGFTNANAPIDNACHIFHEDGGRVLFSSPVLNWLDQAYSAEATFGDALFTGNIIFVNSGTAATELVYYIPFLKKTVCKEINKALNITGAIPVDAFGGGVGNFTGTYSASTIPNIGDEETALQNLNSFCIRRGAAGEYVFLQALFIR